MEWQPIDTAPKDGTSVLLFDRVCGINTAVYHFHGWQDGWCNFDDPTHWMPLPAPPNTPTATPGRDPA